MKLLFCIFLIFQLSVLQGQNLSEYEKQINKADSLFNSKDYKRAAQAYSFAFRSNNGRATSYDSYSALSAWSLAGNTDSAFFHLNYLISIFNFNEIKKIETDRNLVNLRKDKRWKSYREVITAKEPKYKLVKIRLDSLLMEDQKYRKMLDSVYTNYGQESLESYKLWEIIRNKDSLNLIAIEAILKKYGWLGKDKIGEEANAAIFLVIQHSNLKTQEKYVPLMKQAVKEGKADADDLALLTDRIEVGNGRKQIYGSQVNVQNGVYSVYPIEDEKNVNKRRAEVGLEKLEDYLLNFGIKYSLPK